MNNLKKYNGFYKKSICRSVIYQLDKGVCNGCGSPIKFDSSYHVGHIIPRSESDQFKKYYPELDVDNVLNLHALCSNCNLKANSFQTYSAFMLNQMFNENLRKIKQKLDKIISSEKFSKLFKIENFLLVNRYIDLFEDTGKIIKNKIALDAISIIKNSENITPVVVDGKLKYYILNYNRNI